MQPQQNKLDGSGQSLFRQAQAGCRESRNRLAERHDGLVHAVVRRQVLGDLPYTEALQAGPLPLVLRAELDHVLLLDQPGFSRTLDQPSGTFDRRLLYRL